MRKVFQPRRKTSFPFKIFFSILLNDVTCFDLVFAGNSLGFDDPIHLKIQHLGKLFSFLFVDFSFWIVCKTMILAIAIE